MWNTKPKSATEDTPTTTHLCSQGTVTSSNLPDEPLAKSQASHKTSCPANLCCNAVLIPLDTNTHLRPILIDLFLPDGYHSLELVYAPGHRLPGMVGGMMLLIWGIC